MAMTADGPPHEVRECSRVLVMMLDVLGARTVDLARARRLVEVLGRALAFTEDSLSRYRAMFPCARPEVRAVGDCVLVQWPLGATDRVPGLAFELPFAADWSTNIIIGCLNEGVPVRGALGIGAAVWNAQLTLGPAVTDAAEWYERPQVFTAVATPNLGRQIETIVDGNEVWNGANVSAHFVECEVPLKDGKSERMWVLSWPRMVRGQFGGDATRADAWVAERLKACPGDGANEAKYTNTLAFARGCWSR